MRPSREENRTLAVVAEPQRARALVDALAASVVDARADVPDLGLSPVAWPDLARLAAAARNAPPTAVVVDVRVAAMEEQALARLREVAPAAVLVGLVPDDLMDVAGFLARSGLERVLDDVLHLHAGAAASGIARELAGRLALAAARRARGGAEAEARAARLAHASHELRTPLNTLVGVAEILADGAPEPGRARWLASLERASSHLVDRAAELVGAALGRETPKPPAPASSGALPSGAPPSGAPSTPALDVSPPTPVPSPGPVRRESAATRLGDVLAGARARVLVADDSADGRAILGALFAGAPVDLELVADGELALERATTETFDLVLLDLQLPGRDGHAVARELGRRELAAGRTATPLVALSGDARPDSIRRSAACGIALHLTKPIARERLLDALADVVRDTRAEQAEIARAVDDVRIPPEAAPLLEGYLANRRVDAERLRVALEEQDHAALARIGHNVRGTGGSYGLPALSEVGGDLEDAARAEDFAREVRLVARYESVVTSVRRRLAGGVPSSSPRATEPATTPAPGAEEGRPMKHPSGTRPKVERARKREA